AGVAPGASRVFTIHVQVASSVAHATVLHTSVTATRAATIDPLALHDALPISSTTVHARADLSVAKGAPTDATAGDPAGFDYTLRADEHTPAHKAGGFHVSDPLPAGTGFQVSGSSRRCSAVGQAVTCTNTAALA